MHRMSSLLIRSDRFFVDLLTIFIHIPSYPEYPIHDSISCLDVNQNMDSYAQYSVVVSGLGSLAQLPLREPSFDMQVRLHKIFSIDKSI